MFQSTQTPFLSAAKIVLTSLVIALFQACSSIPAESVDLSKEVGNGIAESKKSYDALASSFFADKRRQVTEWARGEYLETLLKKIFATPGQAQTLTPSQLRDVLSTVMAEQEAKIADLDRTRAFVQAKSDEHYAILSQANASVTALLQSAVKVREASSAAFASIKQLSGDKVDLAELETKFNDYLKKIGAASDKTTTLLEIAKSTIEKKGK